jgi:hypothetical protein
MNNYYDESNIFYIYSFNENYASTILSNYLKNFGKVYNNYEYEPPKNISNSEIHKYKVIYIYRNPISMILDIIKNNNEDELKIIRLIEDSVITQTDLFRIENSFDNFTNMTPKINRNYGIFCIKYETMFDHLKVINNILGIQDVEELYPIRNDIDHKDYSSIIKEIDLEILNKIYKQLIKKMSYMHFISLR